MKSPHSSYASCATLLIVCLLSLYFLHPRRQSRGEKIAPGTKQESVGFRLTATSTSTATRPDSSITACRGVVVHTTRIAPSVDGPLPEEWRLCALFRIRGVARAGFVDQTHGESFTMQLGDVRRGLSLVAVDFDGESATVGKAGATWTLNLYDQSEIAAGESSPEKAFLQEPAGGVIAVEQLTRAEAEALSCDGIVAVSRPDGTCQVPAASTTEVTHPVSVACETPEFSAADGLALSKGGVLFASCPDSLPGPSASAETVSMETERTRVRQRDQTGGSSLSNEDLEFLCGGGTILLQ